MTPLFFLPGWCLGRGPWQATVDALGGTILDLPGYGRAPLIKAFDDSTDWLAEQLPDGATLCGWSLGAMFALAIAARHPAKVSRLVLVAGTASFVQREDWPDAMAPATLAEFTAAIAADVEAMLPRFVGGFNRGDARSKEITRELLEIADPRPAVEVLVTGLDWLRDVDLRPLTARVTCPTLICHGEADPLMPIGAAEALAARLPGVELERFPLAAHAPFLSQPVEFQQRVRRFIHEQSC